MAPGNHEHLQRLLSVVRKIDRGSASANRAALLNVREDGSLLFDLLAAGDYERVLSLLGPGRRVGCLRRGSQKRHVLHALRVRRRNSSAHFRTGFIVNLEPCARPRA